MYVHVSDTILQGDEGEELISPAPLKSHVVELRSSFEVWVADFKRFVIPSVSRGKKS